MNTAVKVIYDMREDTRVRESARERQKALFDRYSSLAIARKRGLEEGRALGHAEGRAEGRAEERKKILNSLVDQGILSFEQAKLQLERFEKSPE